mmetsp:Transcript_30059/g.64414  ORF Transcript_30059/g.64414 Transcript_30059/m.64414 type:complete len:274 (-) Transcript_30059:160-981(-)
MSLVHQVRSTRRWFVERSCWSRIATRARHSSLIVTKLYRSIACQRIFDHSNHRGFSFTDNIIHRHPLCLRFQPWIFEHRIADAFHASWSTTTGRRATPVTTCSGGITVTTRNRRGERTAGTGWIRSRCIGINRIQRLLRGSSYFVIRLISPNRIRRPPELRGVFDGSHRSWILRQASLELSPQIRRNGCLGNHLKTLEFHVRVVFGSESSGEVLGNIGTSLRIPGRILCNVNVHIARSGSVGVIRSARQQLTIHFLVNEQMYRSNNRNNTGTE